MMKSILFFSLITGTLSVHALEIDEKLTVRFLKVSYTKKTVLINRGAEDGLIVGDHAKFFITSGVIARGMVEKVSPSRSIWSLYRIVEPAEVVDNKVLNLKIASPVKITADPSKSLMDGPIPGGTEKMDMNDSSTSSDLEVPAEVPVLDDSDKKELEGMGLEDESPASAAKKKNDKKSASRKESQTVIVETYVDGRSFKDRDWELWGSLNLTALSGTETDPSQDTSKSLTRSQMEGTLGVEKYFSHATSDFWRNISAQLFASLRTAKGGLESAKTTSTHTDVGAGASYHLFHPANSINQFIGFGNVSFGVGSNSYAVESTDKTEKGSENFFSLGVGTKYYLSSGVGFRAMLDYIHLTEGLDKEGTSENYTVTDELSGLRFQVGFSYRF